ncbi:MAG: cupin domain-containing protein [Pseudomonadota bacterium]
MSAISLAAKLATFDEHWTPKIIGAFNGHDVMVVKAEGEFTWHSHPDTDDFFLVLEGRLSIRMPEETVELGPGDLYVVPRGVEHCPVAHGEVHMLLIEPKGTPNTGDARTAAAKETI